MKNDEWDNPYWLGWGDIGRRVEVEVDGVVVFGELVSNDSYYDEEDEEIPLFTVVLDDDREVEFNSLGKWRFTKD